AGSKLMFFSFGPEQPLTSAAMYLLPSPEPKSRLELTLSYTAETVTLPPSSPTMTLSPTVGSGFFSGSGSGLAAAPAGASPAGGPVTPSAVILRGVPVPPVAASTPPPSTPVTRTASPALIQP